MKKEQLAHLILGELQRAEEKHPDFPSAHHGYAVLKEELEELWEHVREDTGHTIKAAAEAAQLAATAMRYILNVTEFNSANEEGQEPRNYQREHQGISPRTDVCQDPGEVRKEESRQTSGGGGILRGEAFYAEHQAHILQKLVAHGFTPEAAASLVA